MDLNKLGVWYFLEGMSSVEAAEAAKRIERLGYDTFWIPETVGRNPFAHGSWLLANTSTLKIATGIANIYNRVPGVMRGAQRTLAEQSGGRFLLGIGVSHKPLVSDLRGLEYGSPVKTMRAYLDAMEASVDGRDIPGIEDIDTPTVIAALGPKMLELAAEKCRGAHPYFVSPDHTAMAREAMGPDAWLCVEQKVVLEPDAAKARAAARTVSPIYIPLPNYRNNWLRMGLSEDDFENAGSDKFIDATFAWGDANAIRKRIDEHFAAGANHVCIQPVDPGGTFGKLDWTVLEELAPSRA